MMPAVFDQTTVDIDAKQGSDSYWFRVTGSVMKFDGFLKVYEESKEGKDEEDEELKHKLPPLEAGPEADAEGSEARAALHRAASALQRSFARQGTRRARDRPPIDVRDDPHHHSGAAVRTKLGGNLRPPKSAWSSPICWSKTSATSSTSQYTARLEEELDEIEEGKEKWTDALAEFYKKFAKDLKYAEKHMENIKRMEKPTDEKCERCGSPLVIKWGKHGSFYACSTYDKENPESCTFTKENPDQPARPRLGGRAGDGAGRVLRELRPRDGAEARTLRPVHGVHRLSRLQNHSPARSGQARA